MQDLELHKPSIQYLYQQSKHTSNRMGSTTTESSAVDVLIVGAGPAGLMTANWMSRLGVKTRIIDKRGTKVSESDGMDQHELMLSQDLQRPSRWPPMPLARNLRQLRLRRQSVAGIQPHARDQPVEPRR
jgi:NADPH-dependent 2,4-dienoyl-CoA reductase/sulfur reductase-like enzyme